MQSGDTVVVDPNVSFLANINSDQSKSQQEFFSLDPIRSPAANPVSKIIVDFNGPADIHRPMNWPLKKKVVTTLLYGLTTCWITFASAIYSAGIRDISVEFHVSSEVASSGVSLVVFGFGLGPLLWAPLSEMYGRKWVVLIVCATCYLINHNLTHLKTDLRQPYFIAAIFAFGTATAKDIQTVLITRFFTGLFGSAPITNTGGVMADIWPPQQRGIALVSYGVCIVGGPTLGPIVGGAITSSYLGWRWTQYLTGIIIMAQFAVDVLVLDESYAPALLVYKARQLRYETNNWALHAKVSAGILVGSSFVDTDCSLLSTRNGTFPSRKYIKNTSSDRSRYYVLQFAF